MIRLLAGDCRDVLPTLPAESVQCVVTSPPYYGLRDYGTALWDGGDAGCSHQQNVSLRRDSPGGFQNSTSRGTQASTIAVAQQFRDTCGKCGAVRVDRQIGLEPTPDEYLATMVGVFREVRRVLRRDGTCWVNLGDSFSSGNSGQRVRDTNGGFQDGLDTRTQGAAMANPGRAPTNGLAPKQLLLMPARLALALQADGWWVRSDIIWCLSGGTRLYARTQKGEAPMSIKDMVRLDPATVQLWTGRRWTQVLGWNETLRPDRTYEIELRNGQRIGCTGNHEWPVEPAGNIRADELKVGDIIRRCRLPEPAEPRSPSWLMDELAGWFVGLYIAEGSRYDGTIQIASHSDETERFERLAALAAALDGYCGVHKTTDNGSTVSLNGPMLWGLIDTYVSGELASGKHLHSRCWQRSDDFLRAVLDGYLAGDGHYDAGNDRWRLGFCTNDELVADLRTIGARLGVSVRLRRHQHQFAGREFPGYRGEIRFSRSNHHNNRDDGEIVAIRESRARKFWDIGVEDADHLFALASGVLTHNSKPNPMPESCTDRPTSAHEHVFLLTKSGAPTFWTHRDGLPGMTKAPPPDYRWIDLSQPIPGSAPNIPRGGDMRRPYGSQGAWQMDGRPDEQRHGGELREAAGPAFVETDQEPLGWKDEKLPNSKNRWRRINLWRGHDYYYDADAVREAHAEPDRGKGELERNNWSVGCDRGSKPMVREYNPAGRNLRNVWTIATHAYSAAHFATFPPELAERCIKAGTRPGDTVLDPFAGAGTTLLVADRLQRDAVGVELNTAYTEMAMERVRADAPLFTSFPPAEPPEDERMADLFTDMAAD